VSDDFDVVVVGSGPAGCTAAIMFGRYGLRVALLEAHRDANHYKRLCTHSIRSSALPTIRRLDLDSAFDELGAVRHYEKAWTRYGWIHEVKDTDHGYNIRRVTLDPFLRATAAATPGVELMLGARVRELTRTGGRVSVSSLMSTERNGGLAASWWLAPTGTRRKSRIWPHSRAPCRRIVGSHIRPPTGM
jgi:flavin-dependent dehydrogenase